MSQWKRIRNFKFASVIFAVFLIGVLIGSGQSQKVSALSNNMYDDLKVFTDVIGLIQKDYVEETKSKDLVYGAIKGMLETLDPHSAFMPPNTFKEMQEETRGRFEGLGIEITVKDGFLTVVSPIEGTPAYRAGVLAGDQIIKIDGESTKNFTLMDSVKRLRGEPKSRSPSCEKVWRSLRISRWFGTSSPSGVSAMNSSKKNMVIFDSHSSRRKPTLNLRSR
jgi:carboxyl-terminal processing protease